MNKLFITTIILTFLFAGHANAQFSSLMKKAIDKQAKKNAINEYDPNKPVNFNDNSIFFYQLGDRYVCTANLIKGGKLKSLLKNNTEITKLIINGIIDEKDIEYIKSLPSLKSLDLSNVANSELSFQLFDHNKIKISSELDTLYIPQVIKLKDAESKYWNILPRYVVSEGVAYINSGIDDNLDFKSIQGFPNSRRVIRVPDVLDLSSAVVINNFFGEQKPIKKIIFGENLRYLGFNAFRFFEGVDIVEFADNSAPTIENEVFWPRGVNTNSLPRIKMMKVPKGYINYFKGLNIPEWILTDSYPNLEYNINLKVPGTLAQYIKENEKKLISKLKITGTMDFQDIKTLRDLYFIEKLDLSEAIVKKSEGDKQIEISRLESQSALATLTSESQYQNDRNRYGKKVRDKLIEMGDEAIEDAKKTKLPDKCEIPSGAFWGLDLLEELLLPITLENIQYPENGKFITSKNLKVIWVNKDTYSKLPIDWITSNTNAVIKTY